MILNDTVTDKVELSHDVVEQAYQIIASPKAFAILSNSLYSRKIPAIVRELCCNAIDSHIEAEVTEPFELHLPTTLEPFFSVRDFGVGMDDDSVRYVYTNYFGSTKTARNDLTGALGLGSKSPFAYTKNFTVTAIKDGKRRIYAAYTNDAGYPSIALLSTEDTTERNGVQVQFSVTNPSDFEKFQSAAKEICTHLSSKPNIYPDTVKIPEKQYFKRDIIPGCHAYKEKSGSVAIMGNVAYPIDPAAMPTDMPKTHTELLDSGFEFNFDMGEISFQPSREGLSYIPSTIAAIRTKLALIEMAINQYVATELASVDDVWEVARRIRQMFIRGGLWTIAAKSYLEKASVPTISISDGKLQSFNFVHNIQDLSTKPGIKIDAFTVKRTSYRRRFICSTMSITKHSKTGFVYSINLDETTHTQLVFDDCSSSSLAKIKAHWRQNYASSTDPGGTTVVVIRPTIVNCDYEQVQSLFFNHPNFSKATELLTPSTTPTQRNSSRVRSNSILVKKLCVDLRYVGYRRHTGLDWIPVLYDKVATTPQPKLYIKLNGYDVVTKTNLLGDANYFKSIFSGFAALGLIPLDANNSGYVVYGVHKNAWKLVEADPTWQDIEQHVITMLTTQSGAAFWGFYTAAWMGDDLSKILRLLNMIVSSKTKFSATSPIQRIIEVFGPVANQLPDTGKVDLHYYKQTANKIAAMFESLPPVNLNITTSIQKANELMDVLKRYPLCIAAVDNVDQQHLVHYINLVDGNL